MDIEVVKGTILFERITAGQVKKHDWPGYLSPERIAAREAGGPVVGCTLPGVKWVRVGWDGLINMAGAADGAVWCAS